MGGSTRVQLQGSAARRVQLLCAALTSTRSRFLHNPGRSAPTHLGEYHGTVYCTVKYGLCTVSSAIPIVA